MTVAEKKMEKDTRIVVTGGGTGGHLFPGIALASGLQDRIGGCRVLFIGTPRHLDRQALVGYDFELDTIQCMGLKGMGWKRRLRSVMQLPKAIKEAGNILKRFAPHLVFGVGGYVTGPVLLAAKVRGIPVCIHEQSSVPGLANRILSRIADRIFLSIPCRYRFPEKKTSMVGNPVRTEIITAAGGRTDSKAGEQEFTVLVLGGSQGAHRVNMLVVEAARLLTKDSGKTVCFIHQTGSADVDAVRTGYDASGVRAEVQDFFGDMAGIYSRADLVISRAGATTLAELAVMGLPALLIPYPYAADNHQQINGRYYEVGGGARMFLEDDLSGEKLAAEVLNLVRNPDSMQQMAINMKKMGRPEAVDRIIDVCMEMITAQ